MADSKKNGGNAVTPPPQARLAPVGNVLTTRKEILDLRDRDWSQVK